MQSIYELLAGISATQLRRGNRLEELATVQAEQGAKLDTIIELLQRFDRS